MKPPTEKFRLLFAVTDEQITADLSQAKRDLLKYNEETQRLLAQPREKRSAAAEARIAHLQMVLVSTMVHLEISEPEVLVFRALMFAGWLGQDADFSVAGSPECAALLQKINAIRLREGMADDEEWAEGEGPADYLALNEEFNRRTRGVHETVASFILKRYHLTEMAERFESEDQELERQREIGWRVSWGEDMTQESRDFFNDATRQKFGRVSFRQMLQRVAEIRATLGR